MVVLKGVSRSPDDEGNELRIKLQRCNREAEESLIEWYGILARRESNRGIPMPAEGCRSFGCSTVLVAGFVACLPVTEASSATAPGSSQHSALYYVGIGATIAGALLAAISLGVSIYYHRREKRDGVRGAPAV